ncbi:MAG: NlpC/P60 domain-containing protein [Lachnoclostridium sp.]
MNEIERKEIMKDALIVTALAFLMKEPTWDSELSDEDFYGRKVEILSQVSEEWFEVRTQYQYTGFVHISQLLFDTEKIKLWEKMNKKQVLQPFADVLSMPKVQGHHVISLVKGGLVGILKSADENGWVQVMLCDGRTGYIKEKYLGPYYISYTLDKEEELRGKIVNTALSYMGTQYRWGGKSPMGMDCSGLCSVAYMLNGILIYRDADIVEGFPIHEISIERMKPADLIFFPGHVAMYIGNNKYVHSTAKNGSDGVVINSLNPCDTDYREDLAQKIKAVGSLF